jgi:arylsulfatase A-like enzyme
VLFRSPLIIAGPGIKSGKTNSLTEFVDVFPTICDLAGVPIPNKLDGLSLKPLMLNNNAKVNDYSISQYPRKLKKLEMIKKGYTDSKMMGYSLRTDKYRFTIWMNNFTSKQPYNESQVYASEMYDYVKDPLEKVNVVNDKDYVVISKELKAKMLDYFKSELAKK